MAQNLINHSNSQKRSPGFRVPFNYFNPDNIVLSRAPTALDTGTISQLWVEPKDNNGVVANNAWLLTNIDANGGTWSQLALQGGAASFASLTVNPGPISLTGTTNINISGAADTVIGGVLNTGTVNIGNITSGGVVILAPSVDIDSTASGQIDIGDSIIDGVVNIASNITIGQIFLGNSITAGGQTIIGNPAFQGDMNIYGESIQLASAGTGRLYLNAAGIVEVATITDIVASPVATAVINARVGYATFTAFTTAAGASQVFTITNSFSALSSAILVTANNLGANDAQMTVTRVTPGAGSFDVTLTNNGAAALNGDINICFWLYS